MAYRLFRILPNDGLMLKFCVLILLVSAATMSGKQVRICKKAGLDEKTKIRVLMCGRILKRLVL